MNLAHADTSPTEGALAAWGLTSFDPWDPRIDNFNIWEVYRAMRAAGPVVRSDAHGGFYCLTRYTPIKEAAADFRTFASGEGVIIGRKKVLPSVPLEFDRPEHTRYRKPMQAPFLRHRIGGFADLVRRHVTQLLDHVEELGEFDLVRDLAAPLPLQVISEFLGISPQRHREHQSLADALVHAGITSAEAADAAYYDFMREEVRARREEPGGDFISELWSLDGDEAPFEEMEIVRMARAIALAGHHSTINGTASMLWRMAEPDVRALYLDDPDLAPKVVDESLRIDPPIHYEGRTTTRTVTIEGTEIPEGTHVALLYASGNHDHEVFADAERFDPRRDGPLHLSFGHGIHKCLGEHLSRLEMTIVLEEMMKRFPDYRITGDPLPGGMVYGHHMAWDSIPAAVR